MKIVAYFASWAVYRPGNGELQISDIDPTLCTHLIYSFVGITPSGDIKILDEDFAITRGGFRKFNALRSKNPKLKTMVAIGGWSEGSETFSQVMNDSEKRAAFVKNAVKFLEKHGFDGLDLDWEYPAKRGGVPSDKRAFVKLIKEVKAEFKKKGFLLSAAVGASPSLVDTSYDVSELSRYLDFINLMTYDFHTSFDGCTGHNAPLKPSVKAAVKCWKDNGASPSKLILGIPFYGRTYTLKSSSSADVGAATSGPGAAGPYTKERGMLGYNEVCELLDSENWTHEWDNDCKVPFAYRGNQWLSYDNEKSIEHKVEYIRKKGLGGAMIWSLDTDVVKQKHLRTKFALLKAVNEHLNQSSELYKLL